MSSGVAPEPLLQLQLPPDSRAAGATRRAVRALDAGGRPDLLDDLAVVLSELVTNAVLHASGDVRVVVRAEGPGWRAEVRDDAGTAPLSTPHLVPRPDDEPGTTGRGLVVVEGLADDWGVRHEGDGTVVWAVVGTCRTGDQGQGGADGVPGPAAPTVGAELGSSAGMARTWAASLRQAAELPEGWLVPARLVAVPVRLLAASAHHVDDVLRELRVAAGGDPSLAAGLRELEEPVRRLGLVMSVLRAATDRGTRGGLRLVDIDVPLQSADASLLHRVLDLLEGLTAGEHGSSLLTLPPGEELGAFRRWLASELDRQAAGAPATPCPFPVLPGIDAEPDGTADGDPLLRRLQQIGASLVGVDSTDALHDVVLRELPRVAGSILTALWLREPDGSVSMHTAPGALADEITERWSTIPASSDVPVAEVARTGRPLFCPDDAALLRDFPGLHDQPRVRSEATAVLPLRVADGRLLGSLLLSFAEARQWTGQERTILSLLADAVAQALERTRLRELERASARRLEMLARAGHALSASLDVQRIAEALVELVVPEIADVAGVYLRRDQRLVPMAFGATDPELRRAAEQVATRWPAPLDPASAIGRVALEGSVQQWHHLPDELLRAGAESEDHYSSLRRLDMGSGMAVPLRTGNRVLGVLTAVRRPGRVLLPADVDLALALSGPAASALANAELYAAERARAVALQETLLPPGLPEVSGLELGVAYSAAGGGEQVGGDFYDAIEVDGSLVLAIGDVRGRGVEAAALTGLARHTIRALAWQGLTPAAVLREVDRALRLEGADRDEPAFCTAALGVVSSGGNGTWRMRMSSGGHPAPFLLRADGRVERVACPGDLLGLLDAAHLDEVEVGLRSGDVLVVVTDGVLERRGTTELFDDAGVAEVLEHGVGLSATALAATLAEAVRDYGPEPAVDDMAILVLRVPPAIGSNGPGRP